MFPKSRPSITDLIQNRLAPTESYRIPNRVEIEIDRLRRMVSSIDERLDCEVKTIMVHEPTAVSYVPVLVRVREIDLAAFAIEVTKTGEPLELDMGIFGSATVRLCHTEEQVRGALFQALQESQQRPALRLLK